MNPPRKTAFRPAPMPSRPETIRTKARMEAERAAQDKAEQTAKRDATQHLVPRDSLIVMVHGLKINARIGVYQHEHAAPQAIEVDVEASLTASQGPQNDALSETVDYAGIAAAVTQMATREHTQLVETLAKNIADWCLEKDQITHVLVRVRKPHALTDAAWAGCTLTRSR